MQLQAYLRSKNMEIELNLSKTVLTGKNEEFELFELGRKLYYQLSKQEAYSAYSRFTNENKREKLESIKIIVPDIDKNIATIIDKMLAQEKDRAVVFSELTPFISL
jgi:ferredoxin-nitrite reductase